MEVKSLDENENFLGINPEDLDQSKKYVVDGAYYLNE